MPIPIYQVEGDGFPKSYTNRASGAAPWFFRIGVEMQGRP
jgi:hypothetical protein